MVDITMPLSGQLFLISGTHLVLNIFGMHPIQCSYTFCMDGQPKTDFHDVATLMLVVIFIFVRKKTCMNMHTYSYVHLLASCLALVCSHSQLCFEGYDVYCVMTL